jgi:type I restriction enzyme, S subunit
LSIGTEVQNRTIPESWAWSELEQCVDILDKYRVPVNSEERNARTSDKPESELFPYYGATGQVGWIDDYIFDEEILLLGEDGAPFLDQSKDVAYLVRGKSWVNNHAHVLRARDGITNNLWMMHYLNSIHFNDYVTGTTRLKLNQARMKQIPVPLAPIEEQKRVVDEIEKQLTRLDAAVINLKRIQANLARYKASVLKAACEGRLVPQDPADEPASELLARILAERRRKWEEANPKKKYVEPEPPDTSELPELPAGWVYATVDQLCDVRYGLGESLSKTEPDSDRDVAVIRIPNVTQYGALDLTHLKYFPLGSEDLTKLQLQKGDLLFNWRNAPKWIGRTTVFDVNGVYVNASFLLRLRPFHDGYSHFVSAYLNHLRISGYFMTRVDNAVNQANFNGSKTKEVAVALPPAMEQKQIGSELERRMSIAEAIDALIGANLLRSDRLRQAILQRAFTGKLVTYDEHELSRTAIE